jgi:hypothetical protein
MYFTHAPDLEEQYHVGDKVEVYCDHDKSNERIRDWLEGIAVQFRDSVYLTDGWMVPDHVLWCPKTSSQLRPSRRRAHVRQKVK